MCRCSLRTICLIVAWIHIVFAVLAIAFSLFVIYALNTGNSLPDVDKEYIQIGIPIFSLYFILNVIRLVIAVLLLKGLKGQCRRWVAPFVYGQFMIIIFCVGFIVADIWFKLMNKKGSINYKFTDLLLDGVHVFLTILLLWPVYKYYREMGLHLTEDKKLVSSASVNTEKCISSNEV